MTSTLASVPLPSNNANTSTAHSISHRHTSELRDSDRQIRRGIEMIQDAYDRRTSELSSELDHYKQQATSQRQQIIQLESEISQLTRRLSESERALASETAERRALQSAKNGLVERHTLLRKWAVQLETFRKSIVNMVEYSPTTPINMADLEQSFSEAALARGIERMNPYQIANYPLPEELLRGSTFEGEDEANAAIGLMIKPESAHRQPRELSDVKGKRSATRPRQNTYETPITVNHRGNDDEPSDNPIWRTAKTSALPTGAFNSQPSSTSKPQAQDFLTRLKESTEPPTRKQPTSTSIANYPTPSTGGRTSGSRSGNAGSSHTPPITSQDISPLSVNRLNNERRTPHSTNKTVDLRGSVVVTGSASRSNNHLQSTVRSIVSDDELLEDAGIVYRRIREVLSPQDFDRFAKAVSAFNAHETTASETMREVERLVADRHLLQGMRRLIESAVDRAEASDEFEDEETDQEPTLVRGNNNRRSATVHGSGQRKNRIDEGLYHTPSSGESHDMN
ncbi:hypothetical protein BDF19DRAFT_127417 [Syncephalis fuscata]|nr:hypothetical protein BDF19DRAFT_127417 [Syncephalis fuscata]